MFLFNHSGTVGYTILSVKQERVLEELDDEAKIQIIRGPRTGANSWWQWTAVLFFHLCLGGDYVWMQEWVIWCENIIKTQTMWDGLRLDTGLLSVVQILVSA